MAYPEFLDLANLQDPSLIRETATRAKGLADMMRSSAPASEDWTTEDVEAPPEMPATDLRPPSRAAAWPKPPGIEDLFRQGNVRVEKGPEALDLSGPIGRETEQDGKFYGGASTDPSPEFGREQGLADLQMIAQELASRGDYHGAQNWMAQAGQMQQRVLKDQEMRMQQERDEAVRKRIGQPGAPGSPEVTETIGPKGESTFRIAPPQRAMGGPSSYQQDLMQEADRRGLTGDAKRQFVLQGMEEYRRRSGQAEGFGRATGAGSARQQLDLGAPGMVPQMPGTTAPTGAGTAAPSALPPEAEGMPWVQARALLQSKGAKLASLPPVDTQQVLAGMANSIRLLDELSASPAIEKYGNRGSRLVQEGRDFAAGFGVGSPNPEYIDFRQNFRQQALAAFDYGGKQLTDTEKAFVMQAIPSGTENTAVEMRIKLEHMKRRLVFLADARARLAGTPVGQLEAVMAQEIARYPGDQGTRGPGAGAPPAQRGPREIAPGIILED